VKILADENFPRSIVNDLRQRGHDVVWDRTDCPGMKDHTLLQRAETDERIIFTLDKDFAQLALQRRLPLRRCGVILFRVIPATVPHIQPLLESVLGSGQSWIARVSIVTKVGIETLPAA